MLPSGIVFVNRLRTFGHDDGGEESTSAVSSSESITQGFDRERDLGDQDLSRSSRNPGMYGDMADVATHDLTHHHSMMGLGGRLQTINGLRGDLHRSVESKGDLGAGKIV